MNVFQYASRCEQMFEMFLNDVGKERKTTFYADLSIAEVYGAKSVKDTYRQVMRSWGNNLEFMCEWVVALNQKIWQHYDTQDETLARVYDELWRKADDYCRKHFKGEELSEYYAYID
jgi:hypothetical protein